MEVLSWNVPMGRVRRWTRHRVYYLVETGGWPIWHEKGIGLMARKSTLMAHMEERERQAMNKTESG